MIFKRFGLAIVLGAFGVLTVGCASGPLYQWGSYERSVYRMYKGVDGFDVPAEIVRLSGQIEKAEASGKQVPPGERIHVGYLCYLAGDREAARGYFEAEKRAFAESGSFVDFLMERL